MRLVRIHGEGLYKGRRAALLCSLLVILALVFAACGGGGASEPPAEAPAAEEPAAEAPAEEAEAEPTEAPAEEPEAEATEAPAEEAEAEATEAPAEEATEEPTEEPAEEVTAGEEITETAEMTETEEAAAEATAEPAEEGDAEATPEATEEPAEEGAAEGSTGAGDVANGEYIATLSGGCGCHFNRDAGALAGGNRFAGDFGEVFAPNLTPDPETGIGNYSEQEIAHIIQTGQHPGGYQLVPAMPYRNFSAMSNQEALDVAAYLFSLEPVVNEVGERAVTTEPEPFEPELREEASTDPVERGQALATIARCGECHTSRNEDGSPNMELFLAGGPLMDDEIAANITPHEEFGIGAWTEEEIAHYMQTGERPDGSLAQGSMAQQIDRRFHLLTDEDAAAVAAFLKSIPAVEHDPYAN